MSFCAVIVIILLILVLFYMWRYRIWPFNNRNVPVQFNPSNVNGVPLTYRG